MLTKSGNINDNEIVKFSESLTIGIILAFTGGFMDAYSYVCRDEVFANAQTGNIILFGISFFDRNLPLMINYITPVILFVFGVFLTDIIRWKFSKQNKIHWQQAIVLMEMLIFLVVAFLPLDKNLLANSITSFACGMQVESFRKIKGNAIATTMCIGNLRSGTENIFKYLESFDKSFLKKSFIYFLIIFIFAIGAIVGNFMVAYLNEKSILLCSFMMFMVFMLMWKNQYKNNIN